jgi:hypothetical protein
VTQGYAAVQNGNIVVNSISEHERAAMVNWLVVYGGFMVPVGMGDFAIREHFSRIAQPLGVVVKRVNIEPA